MRFGIQHTDLGFSRFRLVTEHSADDLLRAGYFASHADDRHAGTADETTFTAPDHQTGFWWHHYFNGDIYNSLARHTPLTPVIIAG